MLSSLAKCVRTMATSMPKPFKLALIQLGGIGPSKEQNVRHAQDMVLKAINGSTDGIKPNLVVLPECFNSPYGHKYFPDYAENINFVHGQRYDMARSKSITVKMLSDTARQASIWILGGSIPERDEVDGRLYNTAIIFSPTGELVAIYRKIHLFDIDIPGKITFKESATLSAGKQLTHFDTEFGRIGVGICYDVRFPEMAMIAARRGCIAMIYPGAFNLTTGPMHWELLQRARAVDNQLYVAMCSPARDLSADYHAWGHSTVVDPMGKVTATTDENESIVYASIDPAIMNTARQSIPVTVQRRFDVYRDVSDTS